MDYVWISKTERFPENLQTVVAVDRHGEVFILKYSNTFGEKWDYTLSGDGIYVSLKIEDITHWQPLPKVPKNNKQ